MTDGRLIELAQAAARAGRGDEALGLLTAVLIDDPASVVAWCERGNILHLCGRPFDAILNFDRGLAIDPHSVALHNNRGASLLVLGEFEAALAAFAEAIEADPAFDRAHVNYALACRRLGRWEEALLSYRRALALSPRYAEIHFGVAHMALALSQWAEGWEEYWWWRKLETSAAYNRSPGARPWDGGMADELLVYEDGGYGDAVQLARLLHLVDAHEIVFAVRPQLRRLMAKSFPGVRVIAPEHMLDMPPTAWAASLSDLPRILRIRPDDMPPAVPYLRIETDDRELWRERLAALPGRRVGLCWAGGKRQLVPQQAAMDAERSIPLAMLEPLGKAPGAYFVALQKDDGRSEIAGAALPLFDPMEDVLDLYDTAALVAELDLVISVDTVIAHLAGALGRPVWLLNRFDTCWRWMYDRTDSPWYPTMRIFRQPRPGDWDSVIREVCTALEG
jgi:tetratricopeptide (TPR) repeat protein